MAEFLEMGGYALYVWSSFGVTALLMLLEPLIIRNQRRNQLQRITRLIRMKSIQRHEGAT